VFFILFCNFVHLQPCIFLQFVCRWTTWFLKIFHIISFECIFFFPFFFYFSTFHNNELDSKKSSKYSINEVVFQGLCELHLPNLTKFSMLKFFRLGFTPSTFSKAFRPRFKPSSPFEGFKSRFAPSSSFAITTSTPFNFVSFEIFWFG